MIVQVIHFGCYPKKNVPPCPDSYILSSPIERRSSVDSIRKTSISSLQSPLIFNLDPSS
jgi:hypothetical protein